MIVVVDITASITPVSLESPAERDQHAVAPMNTATHKTSVSTTTTSVPPTAIVHQDTPAATDYVPSTPPTPAKSTTTVPLDITAPAAHAQLVSHVAQDVPLTNTATLKTSVFTTITFAPPTAIVQLDIIATVDSVLPSQQPALIAKRQSRRRRLPQ